MQKTFKVNEEGYLEDYRQWQPAFAEQASVVLGRPLEDFDRHVIAYVRSFYEAHHLMPLSRLIIKFIKAELAPDFDSLQFQARYTQEPLRMLAKLAGLPKPVQCI